MKPAKIQIFEASKKLKKTEKERAQKYSVEFFHIYTDEKINGRHMSSLRYLKEATKAWNFDYEMFVLIDNYNPTEHITSSDDVLGFLLKNNVEPNFWAFESSFIENAERLLDLIEKDKIKNHYRRYIEKKGKYPCSLLAASWYLTRLGRLPHNGEMKKGPGATKEFTSATRLVNILPDDFREVEVRTRKVIANTPFRDDIDLIQDLFYPTQVEHEHLDLF